MNYKTGDIVWYLDLSTETPRIKQDRVLEGGIFCRLENYAEILSGNLMLSTKIYPTKESLLAAIDPPLHNFVVGQTVWYIEEADDHNTLRVEKACVISVTNDTVEVRIPHPYVPPFNIDLDVVFASPQEAVTKALELKQW